MNNKNNFKPYVTMDEAVQRQREGSRSLKLLTQDNGCVNGCCSGITEYPDYEFSKKPGSHDDQEGFYVLEGEGFAQLDGFEFPIKAGDSFIALPGVAHTIRTKEGCETVKVFWFHSGI